MFFQDLPFNLCRFMLVMLVLWVVRLINVQASSTSMSGMSPRRIVLGMQTNYPTDFKISFGESALVQLPQTSNSINIARTLDCIAVGALDNIEGSVRFLNLATGKTLVADHFTILPTSTKTIAFMNSLAAAEGKHSKIDIRAIDCSSNVNEGVDTEEQLAFPPGFFVPPDLGNSGFGDLAGLEQQSVRPPVQPVEDEPPVSDHVRPAPAAALRTTPPAATPPSVLQQGGSTASRLAALSNGADNEAAVVVAPVARNLLDVFRGLVTTADTPSYQGKEYSLKISVKTAVANFGDHATQVIRAELQQMVDRKVWHPVCRRDLSQEQQRSIICSSMFIKEKKKPDGTHDKLKARLVARGDQQDKQLYDDLSAPTVSTCSFFAIAAIAAEEGRHVMSLDIGGAFLNASMAGTGVAVHMHLDPTMSNILIDIDPSYSRFTDIKGCIIVALDMALYGCIEAAALWHRHLSATLISDGYIPNPHDQCVYNKTSPTGVQCTLALHVDDIFAASADRAMLHSIVALMKTTYRDYKVQLGPVLGHLGMSLDFTLPGEVSITMQGCVDALLASSGVHGTALTPAAASLFDIRDPTDVGNRPASAAEAKDFHRLVATTLYLAKRTWPELLAAVAFLSTRVTKCDLDDLKKLRRVLQYINGAGVRGLRLRLNGSFDVRLWVDASYGVHADGKSHTGCATTLGDHASIYSRSGKQKNVTKSSTEAELVAVSDSASQALHLRNFIVAQGHSPSPLVIYQDNLSTMALLERGRSSNERTRHIDIRSFWIKEKVEEGVATIAHMPGVNMFANILTKPLQGKQFLEERKGLTYW